MLLTGLGFNSSHWGIYSVSRIFFGCFIDFIGFLNFRAFFRVNPEARPGQQTILWLPAGPNVGMGETGQPHSAACKEHNMYFR